MPNSRIGPQPWLSALVVVSLATFAQLVLLPLVSTDLSPANAFLALLAVLAIRQKRLAGVLWGASLGALSDLLLMPQVGYHGFTFTLLGYALGWLGTKMVISGLGTLFTLTLLAVLLDAAAVAGLVALLERVPAWADLWPPVVASALITPSLALAFEGVYRRLAPGERP